MPGNASEWIMLREEKQPHPYFSMVESLLTSISQVIESVVCMEQENEAFISFGSYLYRASAVLMELKMHHNLPSNTTEILKSLSTTVAFAKDLTNNCQQYGITDILDDLQALMSSVGKDLSMIQFSTKGNGCKHVEIAAKSLSQEMELEGANMVRSRTQSSKLEGRNLVSVDISQAEDSGKETDLYSVDIETSMEYFLEPDQPSFSVDESLEISSSETIRNSLPDMAQCMEPLYQAFFCPLTSIIMYDPVTIESGVTYDRKAITKWFAKFRTGDDIFCPQSGQKLRSKTLNTNLALKRTICEWKERNIAARIKVARAALSLASTEIMILEAIADLHCICQNEENSTVKIQNVEMIPLLASFLDHESMAVRCATMKLLHQLAESEEDAEEIVSKKVDLSRIIKMVSSKHQAIRHASALLLLKLSGSQHFGARIGEIAGGILMLITAKYRRSTDEFTSAKAEEILKNLEKYPNHIKIMAENGYYEPLLQNLVEGNRDMKIEMAGFLGEIVLGHESKAYVAERASSALLNMVHSGNPLSKSAAFKALRQISSHQSVHGRLVEAGIVEIMVEEMFERKIHGEPVNSKNEAAVLLANIFESGVEIENLQVNVHGHTIASDYIVFNIISWINNSSPEALNISLIRILLCLMKFPKASANIVSVVKETEASYNLIQLISSPNEELGVSAIKLLIKLSSFMGHTLCDRLCKTKGQPEILMQKLEEVERITEKHSVSANFLAKLPHQSITLNLALLKQNMVPKIIQSISWIQHTGTRTSRYSTTYLEGLVGTLVRFTTTLYDTQVLCLVRDYDFTSLFVKLLTNISSDEVQKLSATGLKNLSEQSGNLSKPLQISKNRYGKAFKFMKCLSCTMSTNQMLPLCPVHRGACSSQNSFCLIEANAVERLLSCLDHNNVEVVQAALSAVCTLLDDKVDLDKSVKFLHDMHTIPYIQNVMKEHKEEGILQKTFWMIDRFLLKGGDGIVSDISKDRLLCTTLVTALHHGVDRTREMAEKILRHLDKMPATSSSFTL